MQKSFCSYCALKYQCDEKLLQRESLAAFFLLTEITEIRRLSLRLFFFSLRQHLLPIFSDSIDDTKSIILSFNRGIML